MKRYFCFLFTVFVVLTMSACDIGIHPYDKTQVPVVTVSGGLEPTISFTPSPVYILRLYEGSEDKDGLDVFWRLSADDGYENTVDSPVTYSGPTLLAGQTYTFTAERKDPLGSGDGFLNTRHKYVGKKTFVARTE